MTSLDKTRLTDNLAIYLPIYTMNTTIERPIVTMDRAVALHADNVDPRYAEIEEFYESLPFPNKRPLGDCRIHLSSLFVPLSYKHNVQGAYLANSDPKRYDRVAPECDILIFLGSPGSKTVADSASEIIKHELVHYAVDSRPSKIIQFLKRSVILTKWYGLKLIPMPNKQERMLANTYQRYLDHPEEKQVQQYSETPYKTLDLSYNPGTGYPVLDRSPSRHRLRSKTRETDRYHRSFCLNLEGWKTAYQLEHPE